MCPVIFAIKLPALQNRIHTSWHIDIPKKNVVQLTDADVKKLKSIIHTKDSSQTTANRCRILLALDENHLPILSYDQCVATLNVSKARNSYSDQGIFHRRN